MLLRVFHRVILLLSNIRQMQLLLICFTLQSALARAQEPAGNPEHDGARVVEFHGYADCIELKNESTEVVLCPAAGGRILKYALHGRNVLYLPPGDEGWTWNGRSGWPNLNAGRFDIGPEQMVPIRPLLWQGKWTGEITGPREARLISPIDHGPGVSLIRSFRLAADSSQLECRQTIVSATEEPVEYCHWSRTFVNGNGTCIVPLTMPGRFPKGYVRYDPPGKMLNMLPDDPKVVRQGDFLLVGRQPKFPKLGFDSYAGWLAYHAPDDLLFIKRFPTYPDRAYNEVAALTISIWYPDDGMVELEPIGPKERLEELDRASFTETWYLLDCPTPVMEEVDALKVAELVKELP